jgi:WD40 repeat protein
MLCLGTKSSKNHDQSEIVIFQLDQKKHFSIITQRSLKMIWPHQEISHLLFNPNFGLCVASFRGVIEIFDSIDLNVSIFNNKKNHQAEFENDWGTIASIDYSEALNMFAFGGVSGKIHFLDQPTKKYNGNIQAHLQELKMLKFLDRKGQLISVTATGEIGLWDSQKMTKFQVHKATPCMALKRISSCAYYLPTGQLLMATTKVFNYALHQYKNIKVSSDKQQYILNNYVARFFNKIQQKGIYGDLMKIEAQEWEKEFGLEDF